MKVKPKVTFRATIDVFAHSLYHNKLFQEITPVLALSNLA